MPPSASHHAGGSSANNTGAGSGKQKSKSGNSGSSGGNSNTTNTTGGGASSGSSNTQGTASEGINFSDLPTPILHRYRHAYRLPTPSASKPYSSFVLASAIGKKTPSRAGPHARVAHEALAREVRKNFNAQPVVENEAIVNFFYAARMQGELSEPRGLRGLRALAGRKERERER
ncbi:hypothetical protein EX30DRAFT_394854 [Ascodesmis nigricans]|uniref:Histone deacetylase complex subunit SAP30 Sin3 binding domain-containing protein n=1 Tax=Ascodesmis nigricans TaxID=341454 RepID=A0A4S2N0H1_9PEZI|nr:hypothetical protein EX30DRAFT_394854 [Ascodesmis nigricans]